MRKVRWTVSEDIWLTVAHNNGMTYKEIGKRLGRTEKSAMERYRNLLQIGFTSLDDQKPKSDTIATDNHVKEIRYIIAPRTTEAKSKRLQLVVQPSLFDKVKHKADSCGVSVNDFIHQVLEIATHGENR
jgi:hypothetical protein